MTTLTSPIASAKSNDLVFISKTNHLVTDSRHVAEYFGKRHDNVIRAIKSLSCSSEFNRLNFEGVHYHDTKGEVRQAYQMTKDGFMFLVMGFTGKRSAEIKERYINAFNEMAEKLVGKTKNEIMPVMPPKTLRLLMVMEKGHVVSTQVVPDDCVVFRTEDIPQLIREPGYFNVDALLSINQAINEQLKLCVKSGLI
ncbi:Rha family transcriptional regulator [Vibrio cholerae]|uniref:Rha family transcriptional regulator n=1 Tax=Vibrio cholerae TaxID=666 RepID=UPI0018F107EF|nr:Rha family transcriptional regulator [Vibrio cholerae]MBJ6865302.1 Rha family transcriptional regulator [Vibrio cholerae]MBJ6868888.1 Rha family transcriptional regulator [Vibrio cholerae]MBJ6872473.1 Rha family transcriptional regulator [Vibrio cholerae]MBJ6876082.1 Rha family transcriptional regulator [Vibrio cholerae]